MSTKKTLFTITLAILFAAVVVWFFEATYKLHLFKSKTVTTIPTQKQSSPQSSTPKNSAPISSSGSSSSSSTNNSTITTSSSGSAGGKTSEPSSSLLNPFGNFVSNHNPSLSGGLSNEASVCNTTPGASCYIEFTQNDTVKKLPTEIANSSGSIYWSWDVSTAGFTSGQWTIEAIANLNGRTATTVDQVKLNVQ